MQLLNCRLSATVTYHFINVVFFTVSCVILAKCPHKDHADKSNQKYYHHEGIEDGKPMDLHSTAQTIVHN